MRERAGVTVAEAAARLDQPPSLMLKLESATAALRRGQAVELLKLYGTAGAEEAALLRHLEELRPRNWWYPFGDLATGDVETLLILEGESDRVRTHQSSLVPGLLQTERYAWELMQSVGYVPLETIEHRVRLRMARQRVLSADDGPELRVVLDEAALCKIVGNGAVMREQYARLLDVTGDGRADVRIVPFAAGPHRATGHAFHLFESERSAPAAVQIELLDKTCFAEDAAEMATYVKAFAEAEARALSPDRSREFLRKLARQC
ncbi:helix-turn-helix domain-containing protein [Spirillospora sp. NBC_00431]